MYAPTGPTSLLTQGELTQCLRAAFDSLPQEEQEQIKRIIAPLMEIPRMGFLSALEVLFKLCRADDLARLNQVITKGG